jgi:hypothetical protein
MLLEFFGISRIRSLCFVPSWCYGTCNQVACAGLCISSPQILHVLLTSKIVCCKVKATRFCLLSVEPRVCGIQSGGKFSLLLTRHIPEEFCWFFTVPEDRRNLSTRVADAMRAATVRVSHITRGVSLAAWLTHSPSHTQHRSAYGEVIEGGPDSRCPSLDSNLRTPRIRAKSTTSLTSTVVRCRNAVTAVRC